MENYFIDIQSTINLDKGKSIYIYIKNDKDNTIGSIELYDLQKKDVAKFKKLKKGLYNDERYYC